MNIYTRANFPSNFIFFSQFLLAVTLLPAAGFLMAADLSVHVVDSISGEPLAGVAICVGSGGTPEQFGSQVTSASGIATFPDLPRTRFSVTASKTGFRGEQRNVPILRGDHVVVLNLPTGGGGPVCDAAAAGQASVDAVQGLQVTALKVRQGGNSGIVTLLPAVTGDATHYRASEHADFSDAHWQPFPGSVPFDLSSGKGGKTIYFQVRRYREAGGASVQSLSNIARTQVFVR